MSKYEPPAKGKHVMTDDHISLDDIKPTHPVIIRVNQTKTQE